MIKYGKKEINNESIINDNSINNLENNQNLIIIELIKTLTEIFNELEYNNTSQQKNLSNFFEDSKILFKKLREKRNEIIIESKNRSHTQVSSSTRNSLEKRKGLYEGKAKEEFLKLIEQEGIKCVSAKRKTRKPICANLDFYSGFIYEMIGLPDEIYTPIFAMARIVGWMAHRIEELNFEGRRIIRPAYKNVLDSKAYIPIDER